MGFKKDKIGELLERNKNIRMVKEGLYEQLINKLISSKLKELDKNIFYVKE